jgi:hypothetical protein
MKSKVITGGKCALIAALLLIVETGCTTTDPSKSSTGAKALKIADGASLDLSSYTIATIMPFVTTNQTVDPSIGITFADNVAVRLAADYGSLFSQVRKELSPLGTNGELIVTGDIFAYKPGDKFARAMLAGLGAASFKGDLVLKDGATGKVIFTTSFDKLWAWGGWMGVSKDIDDMVKESEASVAVTVARCKGWKPAGEKSAAK